MNSRLTVAAHVLGIIAYIERERQRATTSDELAARVGTNPVVVGRVLSQLKHAGLVESRGVWSAGRSSPVTHARSRCAWCTRRSRNATVS